LGKAVRPVCQPAAEASVLGVYKVPFAVGDYVTYAGVLTGGGFFAAYEVVNNVAIYTVVSFRTLFRTTPLSHYYEPRWPCEGAVTPLVFSSPVPLSRV
jgi:hypothetical protein